MCCIDIISRGRAKYLHSLVAPTQEDGAECVDDDMEGSVLTCNACFVACNQIRDTIVVITFDSSADDDTDVAEQYERRHVASNQDTHAPAVMPALFDSLYNICPDGSRKQSRLCKRKFPLLVRFDLRRCCRWLMWQKSIVCGRCPSPVIQMMRTPPCRYCEDRQDVDSHRGESFFGIGMSGIESNVSRCG